MPASPEVIQDQDQDDVPEIDLDFHVEFPTPGLSGDDDIWPTTKGGSKKGEDDEKSVLIILLGWAGAQDKYLSKYSEFYLKRGCIVLRYITPLKALTYDTAKLPIFAGRIVRLLKDLQLAGHPTFFHTFSNGGSFLYSHILREIALADMNQEFDFRGSIFDSAPAPRSIATLFKAMKNMFQNYTVAKYFIATGVVLLLVFQIFFYHLKTAFSFCMVGDRIDGETNEQKRKRPDHGPPLYNWLKRISHIKNHRFLFLYSDEDDLIASFEIEKIAHLLQDRGNQVQLHKFEGSDHVQHYRQYPKEYVELVTKFIRQAMEKKDNGRMVLWNEAQ